MSRPTASDDEAQAAGAESAIVSVETGAFSVRVTAGGSSFICALWALQELGIEPLGLSVGRLLAGPEAGETLGACLSIAAEATEARKRALSLLARAEQSRFLLGAKLAQRGLGSRAIALALDRLESEEILSDKRFSEAWLSSRRGREGASPRKLVAGLRAKGISEELAAAAMKSVFGEEERSQLLSRAARKELSKLGREAGLKPSQRRAELKSRLRAQGFRSDEIASWLENQETD